MDLGTTLGYWNQAGDPTELQNLGLARFAGRLRRGEVVARYAERTGRAPTVLTAEIVYYYVFGLFKIAVIVQQIYLRFCQGFTKDARFGQLDAVVAACAVMAERAMESGRIEDPI
jgi:aminoglycoside phosphotransferase (APT) family kinase protein